MAKNRRTAGTLACQTRKRLDFMQDERSKKTERRNILRQGRYDRGYLPHYDADVVTQFVTFRLAGSLPTTVINGLKKNLKAGLISEIDYHREIDKYLDMTEGLTTLRIERIAEIIYQTLIKFDGVKYKLHAWVIMPNLGLLLLTPADGYSLAEILHSIKSYTANFANKTLGEKGHFWSPEYFDRFIRNREHFEKALKYIENNPVKARLCKEPEDWAWSSAARGSAD